jgi:hypothetical protein
LSQARASDLTVGFKWIAIRQANWRPLQTIVTRRALAYPRFDA